MDVPRARRDSKQLNSPGTPDASFCPDCH